MENNNNYAPELKARLQEEFKGIGILCTGENSGESGELAKFLTNIYHNSSSLTFDTACYFYGFSISERLEGCSYRSNILFPKDRIKLFQAIEKRDAIIAAYQSEKAAEIEVKEPCLVKCTPEFCAENNCEKAEPEKLTPWNITPETDLGQIEFLREHPAILEAIYNHSTGKDLRAFFYTNAFTKRGGFYWYETKEGHFFWEAILKFKNTETFYEKYPEKRPKAPEAESPKVIVYMSEENPEGVLMEVSLDGRKWYKQQILFFNKVLNSYLPWKALGASCYKYARPIQDKKQISISEAEKMLNELSNENYEIIS